MKKKIKEQVNEVTNVEIEHLKSRIEKLENQIDNLEQELSTVKNNAWSFKKLLEKFYK